MMWNNLSCGVGSTAQALILPKIPNVMVNTGGNKGHAWKTHKQLQSKGYTIIVLGSAIGGYPDYYHYLKNEGLMPFYTSCCDKAKDRHLDRFYHALPGLQTVNVGFHKGKEKRARRLARKNRPWRVFNFPMLKYTREECNKILSSHGVTAKSTYCSFCAKGPNPPAWVTDPLLARARGEAIK